MNGKSVFYQTQIYRGLRSGDLGGHSTPRASILSPNCRSRYCMSLLVPCILAPSCCQVIQSRMPPLMATPLPELSPGQSSYHQTVHPGIACPFCCNVSWPHPAEVIPLMMAFRWEMEVYLSNLLYSALSILIKLLAKISTVDIRAICLKLLKDRQSYLNQDVWMLTICWKLSLDKTENLSII